MKVYLNRASALPNGPGRTRRDSPARQRAGEALIPGRHVDTIDGMHVSSARQSLLLAARVECKRHSLSIDEQRAAVEARRMSHLIAGAQRVQREPPAGSGSSVSAGA
jgi:hypothetical protein